MQTCYAIYRAISQHQASTLMVGFAFWFLLHVERACEGCACDSSEALFIWPPRFGSRRGRVFLNREGIKMGKERDPRLWHETGVQQIPVKRKQRWEAGTPPRPCLRNDRNSVWNYDSVYDAFVNDQTLKCSTVMNEYIRECLTIDFAGSISANRVVKALSRLLCLHGASKYLRSNNGLEFVSTQLRQWAIDEKVETVPIEPGKTWQNGTNENFNGKFRDESLSMEWFCNRLEAQVIFESCDRHYNELLPHSSLNYLPPQQYVGASTN